MGYILRVDCREQYIISELERQGITHMVQALDIGDYQLVDEKGNIVGIWERKTYEDLASSLRDGRYREQKHRMTTSDAPYKGYILEGHCPVGKFRSLQPGAIDSIRIGIIHRDGFGLISSNGTRHTATILGKLLKKIPEYGTDRESMTDKYQGALVNSEISGVKKENLTPETCYIAQLALIPQISYQSAKAIAAEYPTMSHLITAINVDRKATATRLTNIRPTGGKRLGIAGARICSYLIPETEPKSESEPEPKVKTQIVIKKRN